MRYLIYVAAILTVSFPLVVFGAESSVPATEQEVLERMAGTWVEDNNRALEQIYARLDEDELQPKMRSSLDLARRILESSELVFTFNENRTVEVSITSPGRVIEESGTLNVESFEGERVNIKLEGGERFLNTGFPLVFEDDGFYFLIDGIKRYYTRQ